MNCDTLYPEREGGQHDRGHTGSSAAVQALCKGRGLASGHRCSQPKYTNVNTHPIYTAAKPNRLSHHPWSIGLNYGEVTAPNDQHVARAGRIRRAAAFWPMWAVAGDTATASDGRGPVHLCHATLPPIIRFGAGKAYCWQRGQATSRCVPCVGYTYTGLRASAPLSPRPECSLQCSPRYSSLQGHGRTVGLRQRHLRADATTHRLDAWGS